MAIKYTLETHAVAFPSKVLAGNGGEHVINLKLSADRDNGTIRGIGAWEAFDEYKEANAPTGFAGVIREQAADGNWYVEVTTPADAVLIYEVPEDAERYNAKFTALSAFYNASGSTVRAYVLHKGDIFELSEAGFDGTPAAGKTVSAVAATGKVKVATT